MSDTAEKTDIELLDEIKNGNEKSIDELINKYRSSVEAIAMKYINSPLEKDDLVQEGMIGLLAAIKSYNSNKGAKFLTYACRCIDNSIQTALRKFSRLKDIPQGSIVTLEEDYFDNESVSILSDTLYEELSKFENEVLRLHIVGCSYNEIAERLGKNPKAIDNAMQRIRKKLNGIIFK